MLNTCKSKKQVSGSVHKSIGSPSLSHRLLQIFEFQFSFMSYLSDNSRRPISLCSRRPYVTSQVQLTIRLYSFNSYSFIRFKSFNRKIKLINFARKPLTNLDVSPKLQNLFRILPICILCTGSRISCKYGRAPKM